MSGRKYPWKYKPTPHDESMMDEALNSHLFLVSEIGPTQFLIKGEDSNTKYKVTIGAEQTCNVCSKLKPSLSSTTSSNSSGSSGGFSTSSKPSSPDLCKHIYFVMLKVLRIPRTSTLSWQASLLDTEISDILSHRFQRQEERASRRRMQQAMQNSNTNSVDSKKNASESGAAAGSVPKREIDAEDVCPVCQEELIEPSKGGTMQLVFCAWSCGNQLHAKCMRVWAEHQLASMGSGSDKKLTCPMCRSNWCSNDPSLTQTNEQMLRELKLKELTPLPQAAKADESPTTNESGALVVRDPSTSPTASASPQSSQPQSRLVVKCQSCRKSLPLREGRFMRCVHCGGDGYNLCRVCFVRSKGIGNSSLPTQLLLDRPNHVHCFIEAKPTPTSHAQPTAASSSSSSSNSRVFTVDLSEEKAPISAASQEFPYAFGLEWQPAPIKAPPISSQLALTLQSRDITQNDYELLLSLDENIRNHGRPMMNAYLTRSLPVPSIRTNGECCLCNRAILSTQPLRILPCFHSAHESCLQGSLMYDLLLTCPLDDVTVFPGLSYCEAKDLQRKKKKTTTGSTDANDAPIRGSNAPALSVSSIGFGFGLQGTSVGPAPASLSAAGRSMPSEVADELDVDDIPSSFTGPTHSHHFQLQPSATSHGFMQAVREQRAATGGGGRLITGGTAAFAPPTLNASSIAQRRAGSEQLLSTGALSLSGSNLPAPNDGTYASAHAGSAATQSATAAIRRGRAIEQRLQDGSAIAAAAAAAAANAMPGDFSTLAINASPTAAVSVASSAARASMTTNGPRGHRIRGSSTLGSSVRSSTAAAAAAEPIESMSVDSVPLHSSSVPSPPTFQSSVDTMDFTSREPAPAYEPSPEDLSSLIIGSSTSPSARGAATSLNGTPASTNRVRTGRVAIPRSSNIVNEAPSIQAALDLVVASHDAASHVARIHASPTRSASASNRSSSIIRGSANARVRNRDVADSPPSAGLSEMSIGSLSNSAANRANTSMNTSSTRVRRGLPATTSSSPPPAAASSLHSLSGSNFVAMHPHLNEAESAARFNEQLSEDASRVGTRPLRTHSASAARRATAPVYAASPSPASAASSFNLMGSGFQSLDRGENQFGMHLTQVARGGGLGASSMGRLRRGKTAISAGRSDKLLT